MFSYRHVVSSEVPVARRRTVAATCGIGLVLYGGLAAAQSGPPPAGPPPDLPPSNQPAAPLPPDPKAQDEGAPPNQDPRSNSSTEDNLDEQREGVAVPLKRPPPDDALLVPEPFLPPPPPPPKPYDPDDYRTMEAVSLLLYGMVIGADAENIELGTGPGTDMPDPLKDANPQLVGEGAMAGAGFRVGYQSDGGVRVGIGAGFLFTDQLQLVDDGVPPGARATLGDVFVGSGEFYLGKAFDARVLYPYIDIRAAFDVVTAEIQLHTQEYGFVGTTPLSAFTFTLAPRAGVFVPLSDEWFIDVAGQYGLFGIERAGGFVGLGVWDDL